MSLSAIMFFGSFVLLLVYGIGVYNRLVALKHGVDKAWANIDVLLKQRHDELPKLVEVCKQSKHFEQETLQRVIEARGQVHAARQSMDMEALGAAEGALRGGVGQLFAVAEAYPELRTSEAFKQLQGRISQLEDGIADRREFYNEAANINNIRVEQFPDSIVAGMFRFGARPMLVFSSAEKRDVDLKKLFG